MIQIIKRLFRKEKSIVFSDYKKRLLDIHIVEHCNLNCKSCAHFSPLAEKSLIDVEDLKQTYKEMKPYFENLFSSIHLLGGEPLLHPQVEQIICLTRQYFPNIEIQLVTNGIKLLNMPDSFYKTCADNNVVVYISKYDVNCDYEDAIKKLSIHGIEYHISNTIKIFINYKLNEGEIFTPDYSYEHCEYKGGRCMQLKNHRIYPCFQPAHVEHLNKYFNTKFECKEGDYLPTNEKITKRKLLKLINTPIPFCRFCNMDKKHNTCWDVTKKESSEWIEC